MTVVVILVIKFTFASTYTRYESLVVYYATGAFRVNNGLEEFLDLVDQVVLLFVEGLPGHYLLPERPTVIKDLDCRIYVADVGVLKKGERGNVRICA